MFDYVREIVRQHSHELLHRMAFSSKEGNANILVVQLEGLGNAVLTTPLVQALAMARPTSTLDLLIDRKRGSEIAFAEWDLIDRIWDVQELRASSVIHHYHDVLECHPRRDLPLCIKYRHRRRLLLPQKPDLEYHWLFEKHEADYLVDMARPLGFRGERPPLRRLPSLRQGNITTPSNTVAIGIGYFKGRRADGRDWSDRHWGNPQYLELCRQLSLQGFQPVLVGDTRDYDADGRELEQQGIQSTCGRLTLHELTEYLGHCVAYIGNDTGLMHVAAARGIPTIGIFVTTSSIKSYPLGPACVALGGDRGPGIYDISVSQVLEAFDTIITSKNPVWNAS